MADHISTGIDLEFFNKYLFNALKRALYNATPKRKLEIIYYYSRDPRVRFSISVTGSSPGVTANLSTSLASNQGIPVSQQDPRESVVEENAVEENPPEANKKPFDTRTFDKKTMEIVHVATARRRLQLLRILGESRRLMWANGLMEATQSSYTSRTELHRNLNILENHKLVAHLAKKGPWAITTRGISALESLKRFDLGETQRKVARVGVSSS